jgi:hypothetical protein
MASKEGAGVKSESSKLGILGLPGLNVGKTTKLLRAYTLTSVQSKAGLTNATRIFSADPVYVKHHRN